MWGTKAGTWTNTKSSSLRKRIRTMLADSTRTSEKKPDDRISPKRCLEECNFTGISQNLILLLAAARNVMTNPTKKLRSMSTTEFPFVTLDRVETTHSQNYLAGGRITESITWMTPLEASMSVARILASFTNAPLSVTVIFTGAPLTVLAALAATASSE